MIISLTIGTLLYFMLCSFIIGFGLGIVFLARRRRKMKRF